MNISKKDHIISNGADIISRQSSKCTAASRCGIQADAAKASVSAVRSVSVKASTKNGKKNSSSSISVGSSSSTSTSTEISESGFTQYKAQKSALLKKLNAAKKAYKQTIKAYKKAHENYSAFQRKNQQYVNYEKSLTTTYTVDGVTTKVTKTWDKDTFKGTGKTVWKKTANNVTVSIITNGDKNNGSVSVTIKGKDDPHSIGYNWGTSTAISTPQAK